MKLVTQVGIKQNNWPDKLARSATAFGILVDVMSRRILGTAGCDGHDGMEEDQRALWPGSTSSDDGAKQSSENDQILTLNLIFCRI